MKLYHFCRASDLDSIADKGLYARVPTEPVMSLGEEVVWLTTQGTTEVDETEIKHFYHLGLPKEQIERMARNGWRPIGSLVGLTVTPGDSCKCGEYKAILKAGKPPHTAELICVACGTHRGWLPHRAANFITETINKFGRPTEPVAYPRGPSTEGTEEREAIRHDKSRRVLP